MPQSEHTYVVESSELLLEAPIIAVRRDHIRMPGGTTAAREVVEHFGAAAIVAVDSQHRVAMVYQHRQAVGRRLWELPAGLLDFAGEDVLDAARRELAEEAGLVAQQWAVLADVVSSPGFCDEACRVYLATELSTVNRPVPAEDEEADMVVEWVDMSRAQEMVLSGELNNSIAIAGIMAAAAVLDGRFQPRDAHCDFPLRPTALARRRRAEGCVPDMKRLSRG